MEKIKRSIKNPADFDPDEFALKKDDILWFIKVVIKFWMRNKRQALKNIKLIGGLEMMKAGVILTSDEDFKAIWGMMVSFILEMMYQNEIEKAFNDKESWARTIKKLKQGFTEEKLEKMFARYQK